MQSNEYLKYRNQFDKINLFSLFSNFLALLFVVSIMFLPVFSKSEQFNSNLFDKNNFSLLDEVIIYIKGLSLEMEMPLLAKIVFMLFPVATFIMGICVIVSSIKQIFIRIKNFANPNQYYKDFYAELASGVDMELINSIFTVSAFSFAIMTAVSALMPMLIFDASGMEGLNLISHAANIVGVSQLIIASVVLLVLHLIIKKVGESIKDKTFEQIVHENGDN